MAAVWLILVGPCAAAELQGVGQTTSMYIYINVRSDAAHTEFTDCQRLRAFLLAQPEFVEKGHVRFGNAGNQPWFELLLLQATAGGCYNSNDSRLVRCNLVELVGSAEAGVDRYLPLMTRVAHFLNWEVAEVSP